ncbi:MAG TPA: tRNA threonylcarbamoyladenosine dehydratase, partial [Candidatus Mediterraneibacter stercoravium]|nr:tRNA threonylcarbamoyladenosine dehydratase [Candidatus Mediterraneibacter stercoravium]
MSEEYTRTELLIGREGMERLRNASVLVFGVGGVGSHCIEALARSGVGHLTIVDNDVVSVTNINRQSIALHSTVGRYKTEVMKEKIRDIDPEIKVNTYETFILSDNVAQVMTGDEDYIIDAVDTVTAKLSIVQTALEKGIPVISSMGTGNKLHPEMFEIDDISRTSVCPLCRVMRRELK